MSISPIELGSVVAAVMAAMAAFWQGILTRRAITVSLESSLLKERLMLCSELYSALEGTNRIIRKERSKKMSTKRANELVSEICKARSAAQSLSFMSRLKDFNVIHSEFADFFVWFIDDENWPANVAIYEEAGRKLDKLSVAVLSYGQKLQTMESYH